MKYLLLLIFFINYLFAQTPIDIVNRQIQELEQKKVFEQQKENQPQLNEKIFDKNTIQIEEDLEEKNCIDINTIIIKDVTVFENGYFDKIINPYLNRCNGIKNLSNLKDKISNAYINKGFITSRAFIKAQDLSKNSLVIDVLEGKVEEIISHNINSKNLYLAYKDRVLNIKDLEVSIMQAERLSSQNLNLELLPSSQTGYSIINLQNTSNEKPYYGTIGLNNFGNEYTGRYQFYNNLNYENLFSLSDILSGVLSAGFREALSPLTANSEERTQLLASQLTGILVGGLAGGEQGANNGYIVSTSGELYNRQLHQNEVKEIYAQVDDFSSKTGLNKEKSLELLTKAANMLVDENAYNEYTNSTKYIGVDFLPKDVEKAMIYLIENSQGKTFLDMPTQQNQDYFTSQEYMYKNSDWNPNTKEFYYIPTYRTQSNEILANQVSQQTWYERQKGAENRFDSIIHIGEGFSRIGKEYKNPFLYNIGNGLNYSGIIFKNAVIPDKREYKDIFNEMSPKR